VLKIVDIFNKSNISFKSYSEPFETSTPAGKMQFQMMALIRELRQGPFDRMSKWVSVLRLKPVNGAEGLS
jgi:hypothetical protein